jgi:hypothetical protein
MRWITLICGMIVTTGCAELKANCQERHERVAHWFKDWWKSGNSTQDSSQPSVADEKCTVDWLNSMVGNDSESFTTSKQ